MSFERLAQLSSFTTMMSAVALGMKFSLLYQHMVIIIILYLSLIILLTVFFTYFLRAYTLFIWRKENYNLKFE